MIYGLVGDQDWNLTVIYGISCIGSGLAVLLLPTAKSYWLMSVLCGLFGFFVSANYSLMTVMLVGYLGLEKLAHAYGLIMMIQGLANLGGPPVAGNLHIQGMHGISCECELLVLRTRTRICWWSMSKMRMNYSQKPASATRGF